MIWLWVSQEVFGGKMAWGFVGILLFFLLGGRVPHCINFFSNYCDKFLTEATHGRIGFGLQFERVQFVTRGRCDSRDVGLPAPITVVSKQRAWTLEFSSHCPFSWVWDPSPLHGTTHIQGESSLLSSAPGNSLPDMSRVMSPRWFQIQLSWPFTSSHLGKTGSREWTGSGARLWNCKACT